MCKLLLKQRSLMIKYNEKARQQHDHVKTRQEKTTVQLRKNTYRYTRKDNSMITIKYK